MEKRPVKKFIVITSIYPPSEAVVAFANWPNHSLVVAGDRKTPAGWTQPNCTYLDLDRQLEVSKDFAESIPYNHYGRKMIGYLYAIQEGAEVIIDTDDDNIPYENWDFPSFEGSFTSSNEDLGWVNIYHHYTDQTIWPRGLPLRHIRDGRERLQWQKDPIPQKIGIWQGLADEDPDVDAIYRLTSDTPCHFHKKDPVVLSKGTISPFNSQNTAIRKEFFPLLFLPSFVTFRFTDILRSIIAQPILWQHGYNLGFTEATVIQKRNAHDYTRDFESEVPMYLHTERSFEAVSKSVGSGTVKDNLHRAYEALLRIGVVEEREIAILEKWLQLV